MNFVLGQSSYNSWCVIFDQRQSSWIMNFVPGLSSYKSLCVNFVSGQSSWIVIFVLGHSSYKWVCMNFVPGQSSWIVNFVLWHNPYMTTTPHDNIYIPTSVWGGGCMVDGGWSNVWDKMANDWANMAMMFGWVGWDRWLWSTCKLKQNNRQCQYAMAIGNSNRDT